MLRLPFLRVALDPHLPTPPSLPAGSVHRLRPLVRVRIFGPRGIMREFDQAVLDTGADDTIFALSTAKAIGAPLLPDHGHAIRWRGSPHTLLYARVELELTDDVTAFRWPAIVGFTDAMLRYPILGQCGCLQFFDALFLGEDRVVELERNKSYSGTTTQVSAP